jgi:type IV secretion system protein VirB6
MPACPAFSPDGEYLRRMLAIVDCQAQAIGEGGYQALAMPGSPVSLVLAGVLTIFVAIIGYRALLGDAPNARDAVIAVVKVGIVLALATSWPAFRTLVYDVTFRAPAELAASIGSPAGLPGSDGGIAARLQGVDNLIFELNVIGTGRPPNTDLIVGPTATLTPQQQQQELQRIDQLQQRPRWDPQADARALAQARTLYLAGTIGAYGSVRLIAGLLLALGPLFALFLLFDGTRGLFEGWVRGLAGTALGALATSIVLGVQLAMMETWLATVVSVRRAFVSTPTVPIELLVTTLVFALILLAALIATAKVAYSFRMPQALRALPQRLAEVIRTSSFQPAFAVARTTETESVPEERSRAFAIADAVAATQRRERFAPAPEPTRLAATAAGGETVRREVINAATSPQRLGQTARRRTRGRVSATAIRRDRTS